jgi:hypothetical protein
VNFLSLAQAGPGAAVAAGQPSSDMLRRYRRYFAVAAFLLLATPLVVGMVKPDSPESMLEEGRYLSAGAEGRL